MSEVRIYPSSKAKHAPWWRALRAAGVPVQASWIDWLYNAPGVPEPSADAWSAHWSACITEAAAADICLFVCFEGVTALRQAAGLQINPETAEVDWRYAEMEDRYGDGFYINPRSQQVGREYFARVPGTDVWIHFGDLPDAIGEALFEKHKGKLMFPAGLEGLHARGGEIQVLED